MQFLIVLTLMFSADFTPIADRLEGELGTNLQQAIDVVGHMPDVEAVIARSPTFQELARNEEVGWFLEMTSMQDRWLLNMADVTGLDDVEDI